MTRMSKKKLKIFFRGGTGKRRLTATSSNICSSYLRQVFPNYLIGRRPVAKDSALARIRAKRAQAKAAICDVV
jgi:hypothetical protein